MYKRQTLPIESVTSAIDVLSSVTAPATHVPLRFTSASDSLIFITPLSFFAIVPDSNTNFPLGMTIINDGSSEILSNFSTKNSESFSNVKIELSIKEITTEELGVIFIFSFTKI